MQVNNMEQDIPRRPSPLDPCYPCVLYTMQEPVPHGRGVLYPIRRDCRRTLDYYETRVEAQVACDELNASIEKESKAYIAERGKLATIRNKKIADWDNKYGNEPQLDLK